MHFQEPTSGSKDAVREAVVRELLPVGTERAKIFIKVVFMAVFVYYVITITDVLGMGDDDDSLFDLAKFVVTVLAVGIPSFIGNFQSDKVKEIKVLHKKGIIREEIERFLSRNKEFYDYIKGLDQMGVIVGEEGVVRQPVADDDAAGGRNCTCQKLAQALNDNE